MRQVKLTRETLIEWLRYDPDTGHFYWRKNKNSHKGRAKAGSVAGGLDTYGYVKIGLNGEVHWAHRLAWFYTHGEWPPAELDHINRDILDNRIANLRPATKTQNRGNQKVRRDSRTGVKGVGVDSKTGKFRARLRNKKLGTFDRIEDAAAAYAAAAQKFFGEFANPT